MKRKHLDFEEFLKESLVNPKIKAEYDRQQPEFALIQARIEKGLTQMQLAKLTGTKQSAISRFEAGRANPSIGFLKKLAKALNSSLEIKFTPLR